MSSQKNSPTNSVSSKQRANMSTPTSSRRMPSNSSMTSSTSTSSSSSRRKPKQSASRSPASHQQQQQYHQQQPDFLSFQPALQDCYMNTPKSRRSPPRNASNNNLNSKTYNGPITPTKTVPTTLASMLRPQSSRASPTVRSGRGSKPFASAKYLELPTIANLPAPPANWLTGVAVAAPQETPLLVAEPPSPTTAAAVAIAQEHGFDGRIRLSPLQLIAAVSAS